MADPKRPRILQVSKRLQLRVGQREADGERILAERMTLDGAGRSIPPRSYRVTVNNYLADGGDGFTALQAGTDQLTGVYDVDALTPISRPTARSRRRRRPHRPDELNLNGPRPFPDRPPALRLAPLSRTCANWRLNQPSDLHDTSPHPPGLPRSSDAAGTSRAARPAARRRGGAGRRSQFSAWCASRRPKARSTSVTLCHGEPLHQRAAPHRADRGHRSISTATPRCRRAPGKP